MTALATSYHTVQGGEDTILIFYNNDMSQLAFTQTPLSGQQDVATDVAASGNKGLIKNPSQIATMKYGGLVHVFGLQAKKENPDPKNPEDDTNKLVLLSPGYANLDLGTEGSHVSLAVCSNEEEDPAKRLAWLFYLKGNQKIVQYDYKNHSTKDLTVTNAIENTYLAACYDKKSGTPFMVCQSNNAEEPVLMLVRGGAIENIENTTNAAKRTPIAVCAHPNRTQLQIYFRSSTKQLLRVAWSPEGGFGDIATLKGPKMDAFTTISVTPTAEQVHVFYIYNPSDTKRVICHYRDAWHNF